MQTLETLRRQIDNVQDMQTVVTTMKTLAAVNIRQYEAAVEALADYDHTLRLAFQILLRDQPILWQQQPHCVQTQSLGAIVFGSDQGMCGQFNDQIVDAANKTMEQIGQSASWSIISVGVRAESRLQDVGRAPDHNYTVPVSAPDITNLVQNILPNIRDWQDKRALDRLFVFFNRKTSASTFESKHLQLLPISHAQLSEWKQQSWHSRSLPLYTLPWRELFSAVVRQYLFVSLFQACAESLASENASRIASMQAAEKNIKERLSELQTQFHGQRQTAITDELLDVVTGFEALSSERLRTL